MTFTEPPPDFNKKADIVACFVQHEGKFILLHRSPHKTHGGKFGLPAGKVDAGETIEQAVKREIKEETGLDIANEHIAYVSSVFVRNDGYDFHYHAFETHLPTKPNIHISPNEHQGYMWVTPEEALKMDLIHDLDECIATYFGMHLSNLVN